MSKKGGAKKPAAGGGGDEKLKPASQVKCRCAIKTQEDLIFFVYISCSDF